LEFDHTKAYSKGGKKQALAHKICNRMKASGSLSQIQKRMGFKTTKRKKIAKKKRKRQESNVFGLPKFKPPKLDFGI
jgi:hypothetical protein